MTDKYAELRAVIDAGPTPGPWWIGGGAQQRHQVVADWDGAPYVILEGNANFVSDAHRNAAYVAAADPDTIRALLAERDALRQALDGLLDIIDDSRGVAGYHLNGAVAEWGEFDEVYAARAAGGEK